MITNHCKLSYKGQYLTIRTHELRQIHLGEIDTIVVDTTMVSITSHLINELMKHKIKVIFCDEKRNPCCEIVPYYGSHNNSKKIKQQISWNDESKINIWTEIIKRKIINQAEMLKEIESDQYKLLYKYVDEIVPFDQTNREGHAAKVYFNSLFGKDFVRKNEDDINYALNYGYGIILASVNKQIAANGYLTQLGIKHTNEYNHFNLSSDIMEPFRVLVDEIVYRNKEKYFNGYFKATILDVLNRKVQVGKEMRYVSDAIEIYVRSVIKAIESNDPSQIKFFDFEPLPHEL